MTRFEFAFAPRYRVAGLPFGVMPRTAWADVDGERLFVRFGPWHLSTTRGNVAQASMSGGFSFLKTAGPAHLSLSDHGVTFATNGDHAVCLEFREPVRAIDPIGLITHPNATLTLADPQAFLAALQVADSTA